MKVFDFIPKDKDQSSYNELEPISRRQGNSTTREKSRSRSRTQYSIKTARSSVKSVLKNNCNEHNRENELICLDNSVIY